MAALRRISLTSSSRSSSSAFTTRSFTRRCQLLHALPLCFSAEPLRSLCSALQVVLPHEVSTGAVSVSLSGMPPANFTARAVVIRGGKFVSTFAAVFFEVFDRALDQHCDDVIAGLRGEGMSSVFGGVSETEVAPCSCRDAASTDVAAIPLLPAAVGGQPRMCSLHVDGAPAADVMISRSALVAGGDASAPSLAVQVSRELPVYRAAHCVHVHIDFGAGAGRPRCRRSRSARCL